MKKEYLGAYRKAHAKMDKVGEQLQKGEMVKLCGGCTAVGAIMIKGVHSESVETIHGGLWILTSSDPEVVADLRQWAKRNKEEMQKAKPTEG